METIDDEKYEFEANNKKYNEETNFTINIKINKTCYFKGEKIKGNILLTPKDIIKKTLLLCPITATASLEELYNYRLTENSNDSTEENILFRYPMSIPKFKEDYLKKGLSVPFEFQIPDSIYPSCIIDKNTYVRHILKFDFSTINSRKSTVIIIKNDQHFSEYNELYKKPAEYKYRTYKHKYAVFHMGYLNANIRLDKNAFTYDEKIPIEIDLDCSDLRITIPKVHIILNLVIKKHNQTDNKLFSKIEKICFKKIERLKDLQKKKFHLKNCLKLNVNNPSKIYQQLENDNRIYSEKYKDIKLFPSCYGGLITCEYFIKIRFETDTIFSTDEYFIIPIDFYEKNDNNNNNINDLNQNIEQFSVKEGILKNPKPMSSFNDDNKDNNNDNSINCNSINNIRINDYVENNNNNDNSINYNSINDNIINDDVENEPKKVLHRSNSQYKDFINNQNFQRKDTLDIKKDKQKYDNDNNKDSFSLNSVINVLNILDEKAKLK